ncbi:hypothetical protein F2Q70_00015987 [Brassica cretica]|uniref:Uncharacterized protein n=1 Tax=Brassica cretica TaxID=69181 RepID=A0A8S9KXV9_BRACR|nr:hypothetical protein F2Q70_00015987 [Brassica cretica]KAF2598527.1 hypothetical protein F2Q68_00008902 [Brassica cretica]
MAMSITKKPCPLSNVSSMSIDIPWILPIISHELHKRVICLVMAGDLPTFRLSLSFYTRYSFELAFQYCRFEVNQHPVADVMPVLLKSGQSASREKVVEEMKDCRSTVHPCHRSTVMPEHGPSIFQGRLKPRSHTKLPKYPWTTRNPIYVFLSHC